MEICKRCNLGQYISRRVPSSGTNLKPDIYILFSVPDFDGMDERTAYSRHYLYTGFFYGLTELIRLNYAIKCPATREMEMKYGGIKTVKREATLEEWDLCKGQILYDLENHHPNKLLVIDSSVLFQRLTGVSDPNIFKYKFFVWTFKGKEYTVLLTDYASEFNTKPQLFDTLKATMSQYMSGKYEPVTIIDTKFEYSVVKTYNEFKDYIRGFTGGRIAYDLETTNLAYKNCEVIGFSLSYEDNKGAYVVFDSLDYTMPKTDKECIEDELRKIFTNPENKIIVFNCNFELPITLEWLGVDIPYENIEDVFAFIKTLYLGKFRQYNLKSSASIIGIQSWRDDVDDYMAFSDSLIKSLYQVRKKFPNEYHRLYTENIPMTEIYKNLKFQVTDKVLDKKTLQTYSNLDSLIKLFMNNGYSVSELSDTLELMKLKFKDIITTKSTVNMRHIPSKIISTYGANDSIVTLKMFRHFLSKNAADYPAYREVMYQFYWGYRLQLNSIFLDYEGYFKTEETLIDYLFKAYRVLLGNSHFCTILRDVIKDPEKAKTEILSMRNQLVVIMNSPIEDKREYVEDVKAILRDWFNFKSPLDGKRLMEYFVREAKIKFNVEKSDEETAILIYNKYFKEDNHEFTGDLIENDELFQLLYYYRYIKKIYKLLNSYIWKFKPYFYETLVNSDKYLKRISFDILKDKKKPERSVLVQTNFRPLNTDTGRWSASDPSMHTIPADSIIKNLFVSRFPGGIISSPDFSQMEVRAMAAIAGDIELIESFKDPHFDMHTNSAMKIYGVDESGVTKAMRKNAKFACLKGDVKIDILTGEKIEIQELVSRFKSGEKIYVYSYDKDTGKIVPGRVFDAYESKKVRSTLKITLDNGDSYECTDDHPHLLRNGDWKKANELVVGDSMMPLYKRITTKEDFINGYEMIKDPDSDEWVYTHKRVYDVCNSERFPINPKYKYIHHVNFNKRDNNPFNLKRMSKKSHHRLHQKNMAKLQAVVWKDPEYRKKRSNMSKKQFESEESRMKQAILIKEGMSDKSVRENLSIKAKKRASKREYKRKFNERMNSPEMIDKRRNLLRDTAKKTMNRPEIREQLSRQMKRRFKTDISFIKKHSIKQRAIMKRQNKDPEFQIKAMKGKILKTLTRKYDMKISSSDNLLYKDSVIIKYFGSKDNLICMFNKYNHKILKIEVVSYETEIPVYDIGVDKYHNYALSGGIFVHNTFRILYGSTVEGFAKEFNLDLSEAQKIFDGFFSAYPRVREWANQMKQLAFSGKPLRMITGRQIYINAFNDGELERMAMNYPIQGSSSDIAAQCGFFIEEKFRSLGMNSRSVNFVHDSLGFDIHPNEIFQALSIIKDTLQTLPIDKFKLPSAIDMVFGRSLGEEVIIKSFNKDGKSLVFNVSGRSDYYKSLISQLSLSFSVEEKLTPTEGFHKIKYNEMFMPKRPFNPKIGQSIPEIEGTVILTQDK